MLETTIWYSPSGIFLFYAAAILSLITRSHGLDISYCSPQNNAGSYPSYYNEFQSNGACQEHCQGSFTFAVLQGYYCWCSNYVPASQESTNNCNQPCPGFGSDWCGSTDAGLYGYYLLSAGVPLGTSGSSSSTASRSSSPSTQSTTATTPPSTSSDLATSAPSTPGPSPTPSPTEIYTSITTVTGEVRTIVVTPSASADATLGQSSTGGGGVSTGKVAGIVLGVALGIGALIGLGVWFWFRRRHRNLARHDGPEAAFIPRTGDTSPSNNVPSRQVSQLSSSGLLGNKTPRINTSGMSLGTDLRSADMASAGFDRRSMGTDQRLNPYALYIHDESRHSNVSLQDNQDYSRQLRVANPDP